MNNMNVSKVVEDALDILCANGFEEEDVLYHTKENLGYLDILATDSNCAEVYWRIYAKPSEIAFVKTMNWGNADVSIEMFETFQDENTFLKFLRAQCN